jgi:hypothetical protein
MQIRSDNILSAEKPTLYKNENTYTKRCNSCASITRDFSWVKQLNDAYIV